jgi:hypothetical protein
MIRSFSSGFTQRWMPYTLLEVVAEFQVRSGWFSLTKRFSSETCSATFADETASTGGQMQRVATAAGLVPTALVGFEVGQRFNARGRCERRTRLAPNVALSDAGDLYWLDASPYDDEDIDYNHWFEIAEVEREDGAARAAMMDQEPDWPDSDEDAEQWANESDEAELLPYGFHIEELGRPVIINA